MFLIRTSLIAATLCGLAGCAGTGAVLSGGNDAKGGGIQTRSMHSAPATQNTPNDSRPLSELNTPDAIAAREMAARNGSLKAAASAPVTAPLAAPLASASATAATEQLLITADPHKQLPGLQKGMKVRARSGASLRTRPSDSSEMLQSVALNSELELGPQVYNAAGYWWYVTAGKETGWLLQTDITR